jgi:NAD(P)-dependent dehydrogenase (short-subunit alcohol dehydrogenase family)
MSCARFKGKVALISGAAHGIGRACAERLAREGAGLVLLDLDQPHNRQVAEHCQGLGVAALALACDVADSAAVEACLSQALDHFGRLDLLINSAGIYTGQTIEEVSDSSWRTLMATNLDGTFHCCRAAIPALRRRGGSIINISSMAARAGFAATSQYTTSKSAQIGLTRALAVELGPAAITVNAICPGNTRTRMLEQVAHRVAPTVGMDAQQWLASRRQDCPLQRFAEPAEIAGVAAFLASDDARYITGQAIQVDGGMELR